MKTFGISLFVSFISLVATSLAQSSTAKLDSLFRKLAEHEKFMGSVAIMEDGNMTYQSAWGYADMEEGRQADVQTVYRIGSVTKTFTAALVLQMVERGVIRLEDRLDNFFESIDGANRNTIQQMLGHRSGIFNFTDDSAYLSYRIKPQTRHEMLERIRGFRLRFNPGEKTEYSNTNYLLLGWILEDLSGMPFAQLIEENIVKPLGLKNTVAVGTQPPMEAKSYIRKDNHWSYEIPTDLSIPGGAGNMLSTPEDLLVFYHALFNGKIIGRPMLEALTSLEDNVGLGVFLVPFDEHRGFGHSGGIDGFRSVVVYFPKEKVGAALCSNAMDYNQNDILIALLGVPFDKHWPIPDFSPIFVDEAILRSYEGKYVASGFPLKLTIRQRNGRLFGQATGQPEFPLEARAENTFVFDLAGVHITFEQGKLLLRQGSLRLEMTREE